MYNPHNAQEEESPIPWVLHWPNLSVPHLGPGPRGPPSDATCSHSIIIYPTLLNCKMPGLLLVATVSTVASALISYQHFHFLRKNDTSGNFEEHILSKNFCENNPQKQCDLLRDLNLTVASWDLIIVACTFRCVQKHKQCITPCWHCLWTSSQFNNLNVLTTRKRAKRKLSS